MTQVFYKDSSFSISMQVINLEKLLAEEWNKRIGIEIRLIELFILTISAQVVVLALARYQLMAVSVVSTLIGLLWLIVVLISDLRETKSKMSQEEVKELSKTKSVVIGWKHITPLFFYILSVFWMGFVVFYPFFMKVCEVIK